MTAQEAAKRNEKAQNLKVWQTDSSSFYVESEDGKICYQCSISDDGDFCSCGDFAQRSKNDPQFKCKHLLAVMNAIPRNEVMEAQLMEKRKPKLDESFIKKIEGKDFVLYAGLLDLAHQRNLISMEVELLQYPSKDNEHTAVCRATARTATGMVFIDVGDANPANCNSKVSRHIIRICSTRAKARAMRDLTNIGMTCLEELGDISEVIGAEAETARTASASRSNVKQFPVKEDRSENKEADKQEQAGKKSPSAKKPKSGNGESKSKEQDAPKISEAQKNAMYNLARRRGISVADLEDMVRKSFNLSVEEMNSADASSFIRQLQQAS